MRRPLLVGTAVAVAASLSSCGLIPASSSASGAVGFDNVKQAVIQLEARGTFVDPQEGGYESAGRGSGFIISADGIAVTNNHVVVGAGTLDIWRGGDQSDTLDARVLGASECLDIAVVQLEKGTYPFLDWFEGDVETGIDVYAAGFPLGDPEFTLTRGIVSKANAGGDSSWASIDHVIEHDAKIRPGNSGGPLVDDKGRVVGVNYAGETTYDYNFAIHRDEVLDVIDQLIAGESVLSLGINGQGLLGDEGGLGVWVASVAAGSAADKAGVEAGDLITSLQGVSVGTDGTMREYCDVLRTHGPEATLDIEVFRLSEGAYYRGQVNGEALTAVPVIGGGTDSPQPSGDYVDLVDAGGNVTVTVPASWSDVQRDGFTDGVGNRWSQIVAAPDIDGYETTWGVPGVTVIASPTAVGNTSVDALIESRRAELVRDSCMSEGVQPFADGYHTGKYEYFTDCGGSTDYVVLGATADDGSYLIFVFVQAVTDADRAAIDRIAASFIAGF